MLVKEQGDENSVDKAVEALLLKPLCRVLNRKNENVKLTTERDSVQEKLEKLESTLNSSICESDTLTKNLQENNKELEENVTKFKIELAQAKVDQRVNELQVDVQRHQLQLAELALSLQGIVSPIDGVVVERYCNLGDGVARCFGGPCR